ncbi:MAG: nitrous oxide reductase accessory protein NosL [Oleispira sp.]|nr:nitrous oxide reductase accessory protein NosL [Oleispira sp.]MBL4882732.1 nitrous oxide reductase accessory protein NosL [Oleispira sp.]
MISEMMSSMITKAITTVSKTVALVSLISLILLTGCNKAEEEITVAPEPVIIQNGEECDLCGMYINRFPGPKGQVFERGGIPAKRFCSTRDMFAYALQPEHQHRIEHIFVHDVATAAWDSQEDAQYINAKTALFVIGHKLNGAMGPALASFSKQADAEIFIQQNGGKILTFDEIDIEALSMMSHQDMHH